MTEINESEQVKSIRDLVEKHKAKSSAQKQNVVEVTQAEENKEGQSSEKPSKEINEIVIEGGDQDDIKMLETNTTFADLGVCPEICEAVKKMGYVNPSKIQKESLPFTLKGRDMIGLAETGSGKTAAFAIPVIQALLDNPQPYFACVMSPTRELCVQIAE